MNRFESLSDKDLQAFEWYLRNTLEVANNRKIDIENQYNTILNNIKELRSNRKSLLRELKSRKLPALEKIDLASR